MNLLTTKEKYLVEIAKSKKGFVNLDDLQILYKNPDTARRTMEKLILLKLFRIVEYGKWYYLKNETDNQNQK